MRDVCNQPDMDRETITVSSFEKFGLNKYLDQIEEIHTKAERKYKIQKQLHEMKANMKMTQIQLFPHKKTHVIKGYEDLNQILDEQIVATQGHLGSPFMKGKLKIETRAYEAKLNLMSELIEEISKAQKNWRYLEPIFDSEDISKTMPTEANYFKDVDDLWRSTMEQIESDPGIIDLAERDNIQGMFMEANRKLDKILKSLSEFLEQKRLVFPRFYFLADSDMLMLLAQTKDPQAVQPHMDKCFEGIYRVKFDENDCVVGMKSTEQEYVQFNKKIDVNEGEKKGNVERWMFEIEAVMRKSLKDIAKDSICEYEKVKRTDWVKHWPGQIILAVDQIFWTRGVEQAIKEYEQGGLDEFIESLRADIQDIVELVRTELPDQLRTTIKAMIVIDVHARDVV